jgi:hypothetical protein
VRQQVLDLLDATLDETLLLACRVVFRVLAQVAVRAGFRNRLDDARALDGLELPEIRPKSLSTL